MPMNNVVISKYGTEQQFISELVKSVLGESAFTSYHTLVEILRISLNSKIFFSDIIS